MNICAVQMTICDCCDNISFKIIKFANVIKSWIWFYIVYGTIVYGSIDPVTLFIPFYGMLIEI